MITLFQKIKKLWQFLIFYHKNNWPYIEVWPVVSIRWRLAVLSFICLVTFLWLIIILLVFHLTFIQFFCGVGFGRGAADGRHRGLMAARTDCAPADRLPARQRDLDVQLSDVLAATVPQEVHRAWPLQPVQHGHRLPAAAAANQGRHHPCSVRLSTRCRRCAWSAEESRGRQFACWATWIWQKWLGLLVCNTILIR